MSRARLVVAATSFLAVTIATIVIGAAVMPLRAQGGAPVVAEGPRRHINAVYPEYPPDALQRGVRGTVVVDIVVNAAGDVSTAAVESGPQELRASAFTAALKLKYTPASSTTAMKIAFHYMLSDLSWGVRIDNALTNIGLRPSAADNSSALEELRAAEAKLEGVRVGGAIRPPRKLKDVPPDYPPIAKQARVQGVVIMEARIDESGNVTDTRILRSIPLLDQAAIDAVKQWQYEPTMLNGAPVPVVMTVTVNFALREEAAKPSVRLSIY